MLHKCDNRKCVNPNHLFLGTNQDNVQDMLNKNRQLKGESHGKSTLTEADVLQIRELHATGKYSMRALGRMFGVTHLAIHCVVYRKTWKHI